MSIISKYDKLTTKEKISLATCIAAFLLGWGLTIAGFITPPVGTVSDSVLWVLGQALLYCGAVLGISNHYSNELQKFETKITDEMNKLNVLKTEKDSVEG